MPIISRNTIEGTFGKKDRRLYESLDSQLGDINIRENIHEIIKAGQDLDIANQFINLGEIKLEDQVMKEL